jgi:hypothetical protein
LRLKRQGCGDGDGRNDDKLMDLKYVEMMVGKAFLWPLM